jgi:hypothetical protein
MWWLPVVQVQAKRRQSCQQILTRLQARDEQLAPATTDGS